MAATRTHVFQAPKGTRDFLPEDMAVRRHVEQVWRSTSIDHGFDEIDGPTFEHLELYTLKSGPGIVSELFSFRRADGDRDYALRPEFTPTLARIVAAAGSSLARPTKWFAIPAMFRAERPQRGRLREHIQWNADVIGDPTAAADAEVLAVAAGVLSRFGLTPETVVIKLSHRAIVSDLLTRSGVDPDRLPDAFDLLDRRDKLPETVFAERAAALGLETQTLAPFATRRTLPLDELPAGGGPAHESFAELVTAIRARGLGDWCRLDLGIVRGLAYYTGAVFEVHATSGRERAIAGGGRYDHLIELFGGPPTPAVGIAMGDVVLRLVLEEQGLLEPAAQYLPRPDVFVVNGREDDEPLHALVAELRHAGLHARHSYRATKNIGKLMGEAARQHAHVAVVLGQEVDRGLAVVKDLDSGDQQEVALGDLVAWLEKHRAGEA